MYYENEQNLCKKKDPIAYDIYKFVGVIKITPVYKYDEKNWEKP